MERHDVEGICWNKIIFICKERPLFGEVDCNAFLLVYLDSACAGKKKPLAEEFLKKLTDLQEKNIVRMQKIKAIQIW